MARPGQIVTQFPALDHEPRGQGPPPSYRNSAATEDTWSTVSGSGINIQAMGKRRSSWNNLVQVGGDPMVNKQPPPRPQAPQTTTTFSVGSRASSEMGIPTVFSTQFTAHGQAMPMQKVYSNEPQLVSVPRPAGTIPSHSVAGSRAPSVITGGSNPSPPLSHSKSDKPKRNRLQDCKRFFSGKKTICCICLFLVLIIAAIIAIVLSQVLPNPTKATFNWIAPQMFTNGQNASSLIEMEAKDQRIRFHMTGAAPMKGNFISYYDFNNNQVVTIDQSLQVSGKNLYCFISPMDRSTMPNQKQVRRAAKNSITRNQQTEGWQENWTWLPSPVQLASGATNMFNPPIPECNGSRIVQLQQTSDQKNRPCSDCYDFCLPDYGIMRDSAKNNEEYLNVVRRNCFYLFVPEWRTYAQAKSIEQNQQDFENYYRNRQHMQVSYNGNNQNAGRWISLSGVPKAMMNATGNLIGQLGNSVDQFRHNMYGAIAGQQQQPQQPQQQQFGYGQQPGYQQNANQMPQQQQQGYQNGFNNGQPQQQPTQGYHPAVNGVVNLNGVNGNNGNTVYNANIPQQHQNQFQPDVNSQQNQNPSAISPDPRRNAPYSSYPSGVNSGYSSDPRQVSSGNTGHQGAMNGFGALPSYQTSRYGFTSQVSTDPRNSQNNNHNPNQNQQKVIGTVLNEFGNPVNINAATPIPYASIQTSQGLAPTPPRTVPFGAQHAGGYQPNVMQNQNGGYRVDAEPINYNVPTYQQPLRPDTVGRPGRIFK
ncbi:unnamed protein product [Caenorhabditis bovis]|uniref:Uncharacterized protein n=1 Tax=Caenorhabditis bovis TaxID=2654633 RepID=A0A8S1EY48_9PELO|nr:unnamed protein product [Caenorhabditis bovis]